MFMSQSARPAGLVGLAVLGILVGAASAQAVEPQLPPQALWTQTAEAPGSDTAGMAGAPSEPDDDARNNGIGSMAVGHDFGHPGAAATHGHGGGFGAGHGGRGGGGHGGGGHGGR
ncbi:MULTISPECIES: hypothetical protein [unclassified Inquilinus]|uniref:hypothetical protein n=1 Tax=unclassified Inquilinus TaxID=2645927 RepID=UPI003F8FCF6C